MMQKSARMGIFAAVAVGVVVVTMIAFNSGLWSTPAIANPGSPVIQSYADISEYSVSKIGSGQLGEQVMTRMEGNGLSKSNIKSDIMAEKGGMRSVVFFTDAQMIAEKKLDAAFQGKIQELKNSGTTLVMVSDSSKDFVEFAEMVGETPKGETDVFGYKYYPQGTICNFGGGDVACGGGSGIKTGTYRDAQGNVDIEALNNAILGFLAQGEKTEA